MYLKKFRSALGKLSEAEISEIAKIARDNMYEQELIGESIRTAHVIGYLKNFIEENKTSGKYLEAYFEALEEWEPGFVDRVFLGEKVRSINTWRNLLIRMTNDLPSRQLEKYRDNSAVIKELKALFINVVESCVSDDFDETINTLSTLNKVLNRNK